MRVFLSRLSRFGEQNSLSDASEAKKRKIILNVFLSERKNFEKSVFLNLFGFFFRKFFQIFFDV
jgi:hypothetical protein